MASRAASLVAGNRSCSRFALCGLRPWTPPLTPPEASARHYLGERSETRAHNIGDYCQTALASSRANLWCAERAGLKGRKREGLKPEGGRLDRRATAQCEARKPDLQGHVLRVMRKGKYVLHSLFPYLSKPHTKPPFKGASQATDFNRLSCLCRLSCGLRLSAFFLGLKECTAEV